MLCRNYLSGAPPRRGFLSKSLFNPLSDMKNMFDCLQSCPCGYFSDTQRPCACAPTVVIKRQKRISRLLLDRIHIHIEVPRIDYEKLSRHRLGESAATIRQRGMLQEIYNKSASRIPNLEHRITALPWILPVMPMWAWGRFGSCANYQRKVKAQCDGSIMV